MTFLKGHTYRNKYMKDVDFFVTRVEGLTLTGIWILRRSQRVIMKEPDEIDVKRPQDWSEVYEGT